MRYQKRGQSFVEFALICPLVILLFIGGIVDFGFAFYNIIALQQIANATAKWAAESNGTTGRSPSEIETYATSKKPAWWNTSFKVQSSPDVTMSTGGKAVRVTLSYESPLYTPFYSTVTMGISGKPVIPLSVAALYQKPVAVFTR